MSILMNLSDPKGKFSFDAFIMNNKVHSYFVLQRALCQGVDKKEGLGVGGGGGHKVFNIKKYSALPLRPIIIVHAAV